MSHAYLFRTRVRLPPPPPPNLLKTNGDTLDAGTVCYLGQKKGQPDGFQLVDALRKYEHRDGHGDQQGGRENTAASKRARQVARSQEQQEGKRRAHAEGRIGSSS